MPTPVMPPPIPMDRKLSTVATACTILGALLGALVTFTFGTISAGEKMGRVGAILDRIEATFPIVERNSKELAVVQAACCSELHGGNGQRAEAQDGGQAVAGCDR